MKKYKCSYTLAAAIALLMTGLMVFLVVSKPTVIIDTHEHIASLQEADALFEANQKLGISKTVLLASPTETLTLNGHKSFTGYRENMEELLQIAEKYPGYFLPFCTVNPLDADAAEYIQNCIKSGGKGIKLYNGHSYYYDVFQLPLDSPRMDPIYSYAEREQIPVLFHINLGNYEEELRRLLNAHPDMVVSIPHFMVSSIHLDKVTRLLDDYPNVYTDISFGSPEYMAAGFRRISQNPGKYIDFMLEYSDRVLFGADMVLTDSDSKGVDFIQEVTQCYMNLLSEKRFECEPVKNYYESQLTQQQERYKDCAPKEGDYCSAIEKKISTYQERYDDVVRLNGLRLSQSILRRIYESNPLRFLRGLGAA